MSCIRMPRKDSLGHALVTIKSETRDRVSILFHDVAPNTADALLSLIKVTNGVAAGGASSIGVATGKRLRITSMTFGIRAGAAAAAFAEFTLRVNPAGAAVIGSQRELRVPLGTTEATIGAARSVTVNFPEGFELAGASQLAISASAQAVTNVLSVALNGYEYTP